MKLPLGPLVHGGLLVAGLIAAHQIRASAPPARASRGEVPIWQEPPGSVVAVRAEGGDQTLELTRRSDEHGGYLWARSTRPAPGGLSLGSGNPAPTVSDEFVVGAAGQALFDVLAAPKAVRELGRIDDELAKAYKLDHPELTLRIEVAGKTRTLALGDRMMGVRYVLDPESGRGYAISADVLAPLERDAALQDYRLHAFDDRRVIGASLSTASKTITLVRATGTDAWADAAKPDEPDAMLGNLMSRIDRLSIEPHAVTARPETLPRLARVELRGARGEALGFLELYKQPAEASKAPGYVVKTEHTRALVRVLGGPAEQLSRDLLELLR